MMFSLLTLAHNKAPYATAAILQQALITQFVGQREQAYILIIL